MWKILNWSFHTFLNENKFLWAFQGQILRLFFIVKNFFKSFFPPQKHCLLLTIFANYRCKNLFDFDAFHLLFILKQSSIVHVACLLTYRISGAAMFLIFLSFNTCKATQTKSVKNLSFSLGDFLFLTTFQLIRLISSNPINCAIGNDFISLIGNRRKFLVLVAHFHAAHQKKSIVLEPYVHFLSSWQTSHEAPKTNSQSYRSSCNKPEIDFLLLLHLFSFVNENHENFLYRTQARHYGNFILLPTGLDFGLYRAKKIVKLMKCNSVKA